MSRKEQVTVTLDPFLLQRLRAISEERGESLSSVIEEHLLAKSKLAEKSEANRILEVLSDIKNTLNKSED
jgi:metal-responsive CopG/Arc/MetJ family transcriptional regulator